MEREGEENQKLDITTALKEVSGARGKVQFCRMALNRRKWRDTAFYFEPTVRWL